MKNHDFHFDRESHVITIHKSNCSALMPTAPQGSDVKIDWGLAVKKVENISKKENTSLFPATNQNKSQKNKTKVIENKEREGFAGEIIGNSYVRSPI